MKIGIYGGTFNPIHLGHMAAAEDAAKALGLDKLFLIPAGLPPHKALAEHTPDGEHRLAMTQLAAQALDLPRGVVEVCDWELKQEGKSYTVNTLRAFREDYPEAEIWLLMGTDMFLSIQSWHQPEQLLQLCSVCAFSRNEGDRQEDFLRQKKALEDTYEAKIVTMTLPDLVEISSTEIRTGLLEGKGDALLPAVYGYILRHGLYGTHADLKNLRIDQLRAVAMSYLKARRVPHVLGTEETAAWLAARYGVDEEEARRAALLHDCTKRLSREEHYALCETYHIALDAFEKEEEKLLHAKTGAAVAREVFGVSEEVYQAILWHTTGKADMTPLEKVVYLADYMEPSRSFCDLSELRQLAGEDLDRALLLAFTMAVEDLRQRGTMIHPNSVCARDYLKGMLL